MSDFFFFFPSGVSIFRNRIGVDEWRGVRVVESQLRERTDVGFPVFRSRPLEIGPTNTRDITATLHRLP